MGLLERLGVSWCAFQMVGVLGGELYQWVELPAVMGGAACGSAWAVSGSE